MKVASFLENVKFNENKPAVSLLLDTDHSKEIRIVLKKGQVMESHQAPFSIIVHIVKGNIKFGVDEKIIQLEEGDLISLKPHIVHSLEANEVSIVRLSLSKSDTLTRVKNV